MKIEAAGAGFSPCGDRFVPGGYRVGLDFEGQVEQLSKIEGLTGLPLMYPLDYTSTSRLKELVKKYNLQIGTICPDTYAKAEWKDGSLASRDASVRKKIIKTIKESMDFCNDFNGDDILLWLAHDGYDYAFEDDYRVRWDYIIDGLREVSSYRKDVRVTIEYKAKEPRIHQYVSNAGKSLLICEEINNPNLGVVLDIGHSLQAGENPAESVALLDRYKRLFHIHLNDNYRSWDDDLLLGSVHFWETLEFFYWLDRVGYDGWYVIDIWPARIDGFKALQESVRRTQQLMQLAKSLPYDQLKKMQDDNATMDIMELLRKQILK